MWIKANTPDRLVLEDRPWLLGSILAFVIVFMAFLALVLGADALWRGVVFGLGAALFGGAFVAFVRRVIVILDRGAGAVVIRSVGLLGQTETTLPLADIAAAAVETVVNRSTSTNGRLPSVSETHRVVLQVKGQPVPLTRVYSAGPGAANCAAAINHWLAQVQTGVTA
jgi:hypothetical protein